MNQYERTFYENRLTSANRLYNQVFEWFRSQVARNEELQDENEALTARNEELQENVDLLLDNLDIAVKNGIDALAERDKEIDNLKRRITDLEFGVKNNESRFAPGTVVRSSISEWIIIDEKTSIWREQKPNKPDAMPCIDSTEEVVNAVNRGDAHVYYVPERE